MPASEGEQIEPDRGCPETRAGGFDDEGECRKPPSYFNSGGR